MQALVAQAKSWNMTVLLKPHVDCLDGNATSSEKLLKILGTWRAWIGTDFTEKMWDDWFKNYEAYMIHYAILSQKWGVDIFSCGVEMITASRHAHRFRHVVQTVRRFFSGKVTYSANWGTKYQIPRTKEPLHLILQAEKEDDRLVEKLEQNVSENPKISSEQKVSEEIGEIDTITWIDALDVIGVDSYYFLTNDDKPNLEELLDAWQPVLVKFQNLTKFWNKNLIFTEIGTCFSNSCVYFCVRFSEHCRRCKAPRMVECHRSCKCHTTGIVLRFCFPKIYWPKLVGRVVLVCSLNSLNEMLKHMACLSILFFFHSFLIFFLGGFGVLTLLMGEKLTQTTHHNTKKKPWMCCKDFITNFNVAE